MLTELKQLQNKLLTATKNRIDFISSISDGSIPQHLFDEMSKLAINIFDKYDDTYWYATQKKDFIKSIENKNRNIFIIYRMLDYENQTILYSSATEELRKLIDEYHIEIHEPLITPF